MSVSQQVTEAMKSATDAVVSRLNQDNNDRTTIVVPVVVVISGTVVLSREIDAG